MKKKEVCPACGRETGGVVPCPHCLADPGKRIPWTYILAACAALLLIGACALAAYARSSAEEPVEIARIDTWMDYSYGWVDGTVTSGPLYGRNYVSFSVSDFSSSDLEKSTIEVRVYSPAFEELLGTGRIPRVGDGVRVFGQMRVASERSKMMTVSLADDLRIRAADPVPATPTEVLEDAGLLFRRVVVEGTVVRMRVLSSASIYYISDGRSEVQLYVPLGLEVYAEKRPLGLTVLDRVRVTAGVSSYKGTPQLSIGSFSDVEVIGREEAERVELSRISENMIGRYVATSGRIILCEAVGAATSLEISERVLWLDDPGLPRVYLDEDIFQSLPLGVRGMVRRGSEIELVGRVENREGRTALTFVGPQIPTLKEGEFVPPAAENLAPLEAGALAAVAGRVAEVSAVEKGLLPPDRLLTVESGSGSVRVLIPNFIYERMPRPPGPGESIAAVGAVSVYRGEKVLRVCALEDVWRV